jgi:hypothetical protein
MNGHPPGLVCFYNSSKFSSNEAASRPGLEFLVLGATLDRPRASLIA